MAEVKPIIFMVFKNEYKRGGGEFGCKIIHFAKRTTIDEEAEESLYPQNDNFSILECGV